MIFVAGVWMIATDVVLGLVAVAVFPILIVLNVVYQHRVDRHYSEAQDELGALSAGVHESFEGVQLIKAYGAEARETERLSTIAGRIRDARIRAVRLRGTFEATLEVIPSMVNVGLVVLGAHRVNSGDLTVGQLSGFIYMFTLLVFPLRLIGFALSELPHSLAGWNRIRTVLDEPIEPDPGHAIGEAAPGNGARARRRDVRVRGRRRSHVVGDHPDRADWSRRGGRRADGRGQDDVGRGHRRPAGAGLRIGPDVRGTSAGVPGGVLVLGDRPRQPPDRHAVRRRRAVGGTRDGGRRPVRARSVARARHGGRRTRREPERWPTPAPRARAGAGPAARPAVARRHDLRARPRHRGDGAGQPASITR